MARGTYARPLALAEARCCYATAHPLQAQGGSEQILAIDALQFEALFLGKNEHIALGPDVHVCPRRFEAVGTVGAQAATPAPKSDRVGPASHTPRAGACRLLELLACAPRRHRWSTIPARLWRNRSAAHLNLSPRQWRWLTKFRPTPSFGKRFTTTCGSNILNGCSQMASLPFVILTRRASWCCSML